MDIIREIKKIIHEVFEAIRESIDIIKYFIKNILYWIKKIISEVIDFLYLITRTLFVVYLPPLISITGYYYFGRSKAELYLGIISAIVSTSLFVIIKFKGKSGSIRKAIFVLWIILFTAIFSLRIYFFIAGWLGSSSGYENNNINKVVSYFEDKPRNEIVCSKNVIMKLGKDDVLKLQKALSSDKNIYPAGAVTGNFGKLTIDAIRKFQEKYDLDKTGKVDQCTMMKIKEVFPGAY
jgi:hypothetical protein